MLAYRNARGRVAIAKQNLRGRRGALSNVSHLGPLSRTWPRSKAWPMQRKDLEKLSRAELVAQAEDLGVTRPRTLTMPELVDEILLVQEKRTGQKRSRGWFGRARDLLTSVIDRGMSADPTRKPRPAPAAPQPLPTVTLAEIYAAQGHFERAIATLDEVITRDPAHAEARKLRDRFAEQLRRTRPSSPPPPESRVPISGASSTPLPSQGEPAPPAPSPAEPSPTATAPAPQSLDPSVTDAPAAIDERYDVDEVVAIAVDPHTIYA
jgi:hypothetical protein